MAILCAGSLALALVALFLIWNLGPGTVLLVSVLALVPLGLCVAGLLWVDRWDPEPRLMLVAALFWGAGASVAGTLLFGDAFSAAFFNPSGLLDAELFGTVVQAPIVEELAKGLGVLLIFLVGRSQFDEPVDGIVYGGMVGAEFAFTENILYFGTSYLEAGNSPGALAGIFVLRGLFSPFAHVMFTAWTGYALGKAAQRGARSRWPLYFTAGLLPAMLGHFLWNGGTMLFFDTFFGFYFLLQVPLFIASVAAVFMLRRGERMLAARNLGAYQRDGWFTEAEVAMFSTRAGRRAARAWAQQRGRAAQMQDFTRAAMRLAAVRQRIAAGHADPRDLQIEAALLASSARQRQLMLAGGCAG
ncbi:PrsW family intramembrane metalloprotease [Paeniglutamicibacter cryotolerans]|uniref:PrsW family intramembrane metalloprotease n=1 Tax=Paeniglutamicibacter cryotolerans TaxID=670079 RepID=UPI001C8488AF|nr:PrsW family intramembrane metalloprotease [Paeniglutamicibacter cryotolerans]